MNKDQAQKNKQQPQKEKIIKNIKNLEKRKKELKIFLDSAKLKIVWKKITQHFLNSVFQ